MLQASVSFTSVEREKNVIYHMARNICVREPNQRWSVCLRNNMENLSKRRSHSTVEREITFKDKIQQMHRIYREQKTLR
jgi:hypothetical protein